MPWLVSILMIGHVMGARPMVSTRRSVIFRSEGLECVLVFCGRASSVSSAQKPAPAREAAFRKARRGAWDLRNDFIVKAPWHTQAGGPRYVSAACIMARA